MNKVTYKEIARAQIGKYTAFVVSECSDGGYTLAKCQSMVDESTGMVQEIFLKGASKLKDIETLEKLEKMFQLAIDYVRKQENK